MDYYRAVYLSKRTLQCLVHEIASACNVEPTLVIRTLRVRKPGIYIQLDDESVCELSEGQDMVAHFREIRTVLPSQKEEGDGLVDEEDGALNASSFMGYELRLIF
jgi:hypothetical protein